MGFLKPHVSNQGLLDNTPGDPDGYVTEMECETAYHGQEREKGLLLYITVDECMM